MPKMRKKRERFDVIQVYRVAFVPRGSNSTWAGSGATEQRRRILSRHKTREEANDARDARLVLEEMKEAPKSVSLYVQRQTYTLAKRPD